MRVLARITYLERLNNSVNGNPAWRIGYRREDDGQAVSTRTQSDASVSYEIGNPGRRVDSLVWLHLTKSGNVSYISDPPESLK